MKECSHLPHTLPASLALAASLMLCGTEMHAQDRYRAVRDENFRLEPDPTGRLLARVNRGTELASSGRRGNWVQVTLAGWIWSQSVRPDTRSGFDLAVSSANGENLRAGPNGTVVARLLTGFLLEELDREREWVHVQRSGWMWGASLERIGGASTARPPVAQPAAQPDTPGAPGQVVGGRARAAASTGLLRTAGGDTAGVLRAGTPVRVVSRSGGWARVQVDAWVRDTELDRSGGEVLTGVTGAEVRSRPAEYEGQLVEWTLQYIAVPSADELRREIPAGRRYMLARGPVPERGFVYVILPDARVSTIEALEPLAEITLIGRVQTARSHYLGNPVLELVELVFDQP